MSQSAERLVPGDMEAEDQVCGFELGSAARGNPGRLAVKSPSVVDQIAELILLEEAWWIGARTGQYVVKSTVWVDGSATPMLPMDGKHESLLEAITTI